MIKKDLISQHSRAGLPREKWDKTRHRNETGSLTDAVELVPGRVSVLLPPGYLAGVLIDRQTAYRAVQYLLVLAHPCGTYVHKVAGIVRQGVYCKPGVTLFT